MMGKSVRWERVERPLAVVVPVLVVGAALVALILSTATFYLANFLTIYSLLTGLAGGAFGGLLSHRLGRRPMPAGVIAGVFFGLLTAGLFSAFVYLFFALDAAPATGFPDFARLLLWTSPLGKIVRIVAGTNDPVAVLVLLVDGALMIWSAAFVAVHTHRNMARLQPGRPSPGRR